jgi:hypothetical protein
MYGFLNASCPFLKMAYGSIIMAHEMETRDTLFQLLLSIAGAVRDGKDLVDVSSDLEEATEIASALYERELK